MKYRHTEIMANSDLGPAGTHLVDLNVTDPISRITLRFAPLGGSFIPAAHPATSIVRLELIDGSDVLYGLTGQVGQALNIFDKSNPTFTSIPYMTGQPCNIALNIDFGRYLWDKELAFDPKKFKNPQIRLTHNEALWQALCTIHTFQIYAHMFDEKEISPMGFLSAKEIKAYVPVATGFEYTDLPTDYSMRKLIVQPYRLAGGPRGIVDHYRLNEDNDKRVVFDGDLFDLRSWLDSDCGRVDDNIIMNCPLAGRAGYATAHHLDSVGGFNLTASNALAVVTAGNQLTVTPATAAANVMIRASGVNPHACVPFPFGDQMDINDWYDVQQKGTVELRLRGGPAAVATDTVRIAVQQMRPY